MRRFDAPAAFAALVERYDPEVFAVVLDGEGATLEVADGHRADAVLTADARTWTSLARDVRAGMAAFRSGRLRVRRDLHLGVGLLAASAAAATAACASATSGRPPARFARHVREALPDAEHLTLDCGHVPQLERPQQTHAALSRFLGDGRG